MLRLLGILCLMTGSIGIGWSLRCRMKLRVEQLYQLRRILKLFQSEIIYSHASLPEACRQISGQVPPPYKEAFLAIHEQMRRNTGQSFDCIWKCYMGNCLKKLEAGEEERRILYEFGESAGVMDGQLQSGLIGQSIEKLELSIEGEEKELANKCRLAMSLSVMGGLMLTVILI